MKVMPFLEFDSKVGDRECIIFQRPGRIQNEREEHVDVIVAGVVVHLKQGQGG